MPKLKPQYSGHLMRRASSLEKTLMLGKTEGKRRSRQERMRWLDGITKLWETVKDREAWGAAGQGVTKRYDLATEQQQAFQVLSKSITLSLNLDTRALFIKIMIVKIKAFLTTSYAFNILPKSLCSVYATIQASLVKLPSLGKSPYHTIPL